MMRDHSAGEHMARADERACEIKDCYGLIDHKAKAICADCEGLEFVYSSPDNTLNEWRWQDYVTTAEKALCSVEAAGCAVVPAAPRLEMCRRVFRHLSPNVEKWYEHVLDASPFKQGGSH